MNTRPKPRRLSGCDSPERALRLMAEWADYLRDCARNGRPVAWADAEAFTSSVSHTGEAITSYGNHMYERAKGELLPLFGKEEG